MSSKLKTWMHIASKKEQDQLAHRARTSRAYLYQLSTHQREASAELAGRIEKVAAKLRTKNPELPELRRTDLCNACASCPYAKACKP